MKREKGRKPTEKTGKEDFRGLLAWRHWPWLEYQVQGSLVKDKMSVRSSDGFCNDPGSIELEQWIINTKPIYLGFPFGRGGWSGSRLVIRILPDVEHLKTQLEIG